MTTTARVGQTVLDQIGIGVLMSLGASAIRHGNVAMVPGATPLPSLIFNARILPFTKGGKRGSAPRSMLVVVGLNERDLYDVLVTYKQHGDRYGMKPPVVHFEADDVFCDDLAALLLALDYDGITVLNPRCV